VDHRVAPFDQLHEAFQGLRKQIRGSADRVNPFVQVTCLAIVSGCHGDLKSAIKQVAHNLSTDKSGATGHQE